METPDEQRPRERVHERTPATDAGSTPADEEEPAEPQDAAEADEGAEPAEPDAGWRSGAAGPEQTDRPPRRRPAGAGTALLVLVSAVIGGLVALLVLPYVAPAYYTNLNPPRIPVAQTPPSANTSVAEAVFRKTAPAVVSVVNRSTTHNFFGQTQIQEGTGSGVIFDARGYIVTNYHVVAGAQQLTVILPNGDHLPAKLIGGDPPSDLAVVKVDAGHPLPVADFADSNKVVPGQWAVAIGSPLGLDLSQTVTIGVVSGIRTMLYGYGQEQRDTKLIQTDAAINPGNSGGPLCNAAGQVIGLNTWKVASVPEPSQSVAAEGIGFAVPSNTVRAVADDLVKYGHVRRAFLGVEIGVSQQAAATCATEPLEVTGFTPGSPAEKAGMQKGDVITAFDGHAVHSYCDLIIATDNAHPGQVVPVTVVRGTRVLTLNVRLGQAPPQKG